MQRCDRGIRRAALSLRVGGGTEDEARAAGTRVLVATCGLIYELLAGTLASYVLGDSVTQFSLIIGVYLSAMGVTLAWQSTHG